MAELIEMPYRVLTLVGLRKHVLDGGQCRTNPYAAVRSDKRRCGLSSKCFDHLFSLLLHFKLHF